MGEGTRKGEDWVTRRLPKVRHKVRVGARPPPPNYTPQEEGVASRGVGR